MVLPVAHVKEVVDGLIIGSAIGEDYQLDRRTVLNACPVHVSQMYTRHSLIFVATT